eukprot:SAG22_NODE_949_length_6356_cov_2.100527_8_plen_107_part_01
MPRFPCRLSVCLSVCPCLQHAIVELAVDERVKETERQRAELTSRKAMADEQLEALRQEVASARYMQTLYSAGGGAGSPTSEAAGAAEGAAARSGDDVDAESSPVGGR